MKMPQQFSILGSDDDVVRELAKEIDALAAGEWEIWSGAENPPSGSAAIVYAPVWRRGRVGIDLADADRALQGIVAAHPACAVLISSTEVYGASHRSVGLAAEEDIITSEKRNPVGQAWIAMEDLATRALADAGIPLTIFRAAPQVLSGRKPFGRLTVCHAGYDPSIQLLSVHQLGRAVVWAGKQRATEVFNLAPDDAVALRAALRLAGARAIPFPSSLQRLIRAGLSRLGLADSAERAEYLRYPFTVSSERLRAAGHEVTETTLEALAAIAGPGRGAGNLPANDPFGVDAAYLEAHGRGLIGFLRSLYWRVETKGQEHLPGEGAAILVGVHRGFMPWDGVITADAIYRHCRRVPRFLIHPCLVKFPFLANFMRKLGGVMAGRRNAVWLLSRGDLVGVYPEGIRGAFTYYKDAYRIGKAWRDDYAQFALEFDVPVIPFVTVGSAEIYPIFAKVHWSWWKRWTEWPCLPITTTFPLIPFPLPSKWHLRFLPPIWPRDIVPEGTDREEARRRFDAHVRGLVEGAMVDLRSRRRSPFWGSVAEPEDVE